MNATNGTRTPQRVPASCSYGPVLRFADWWAGKVEPSTVTGLTPHLARLTSTWQEKDAALIARVRDGLTPSVLALARARQQFDSLEDAPAPPVVDLDTVHPGEVHLSASDVRARRRGDQAAADTLHAARAAAATQARAALLATIAQHTAIIEDAWEVAAGLSFQLWHFYHRRAGTYVRTLGRRGITVAVPVLEPGAWVRPACPWLPAADEATRPQLTSLPTLEPDLQAADRQSGKEAVA